MISKLDVKVYIRKRVNSRKAYKLKQKNEKGHVSV